MNKDVRKNGYAEERPAEPHGTSSDLRPVSDISLGQHRLSTCCVCLDCYEDSQNGAKPHHVRPEFPAPWERKYESGRWNQLSPRWLKPGGRLAIFNMLGD
ncbi:hypothetical protein PMIN07_002307 [Paraphaeosphaeria minitans]